MSLSNYGELKAAVAKWATKSSLADQVPDFVAWAHQEIGRRLRAPILYARSDVDVDAETVEAPDGFLAAKAFYLDVFPRRTLQVTDSSHLIDISAECSPGPYPTHFAVEGTSTLVFAPLFSTGATGRLLFYKAPDQLVDDGDTNVVLAKYPFLYLWGALEALFRYVEDDNNTDRYAGMFGALIESINALETRDAYRGPLAPSPGTAVV